MGAFDSHGLIASPPQFAAVRVTPLAACRIESDGPRAWGKPHGDYVAFAQAVGW